MGVLTLERTTRATPEQLWQVVTDWSGYARWMPLTTMRLDDGPTRVGWSFAGRSGVGPLRFADVMVITSWEPPRDGPGAVPAAQGRPAARRLGGRVGRARRRWCRCGAALDRGARPAAADRRPPAGRAADPVNRWMFGRAVDAMVAEAEALAVSRPE